MTQRINWLDTSRGLAFLMVIYYHLSTRGMEEFAYCLPIFLTTFFFVSGYLTKSGLSFGKYFEQRTRTLLVPLLIFGLGGGIVLIACRLGKVAVLDGLIDVVEDVFVQKTPHNTLWFIATLYLYSLIFYWVDRYCSNEYILLIVCLCLFALNSVYNVLDGEVLNWRINSLGFGCFYMGLGKVYRRYEYRIDNALGWKWTFLCAVGYFTYIAITGNTVNFGGDSYFGIVALPLSLSGLAWVIWLSKHVTVNSKCLQFIGTNTLLYFCLHRQVLNGVESIVNKFLSKISMEPSVWMNLIEVVVIAALLAVPTWFINKYIPQVTGKGWKLWKV